MKYMSFVLLLGVSALTLLRPAAARAATDEALPHVPAHAATSDLEEEDGALPGPARGANDPGPAVPQASDVPPPSRRVFIDEACDFEPWVGKTVDAAALERLGRPYRILTPDAPATMDRSPARVNLEVRHGLVTRVWCG